ncbi:hypothetical protein ENUP19_0085G0062 [Entamoeba nuttalli]|uniref:Uncharacterized protein n=2 Tax=Entamoeba nuttalli TaxID=412467 RepID=K2H3H9_ENTNP|nr:hypothetical protein ENU1_212890 [Entamoeba nuttalli P19]EKE36994.1 hypothetical protein ENU1_212890 [Entamoeba nuttalli P19]|eukprot:XP_008860673.1 hypothetical protein ENU1_212890 [Entamoeba nuttalli P19]
MQNDKSSPTVNHLSNEDKQKRESAPKKRLTAKEKRANKILKMMEGAKEVNALDLVKKSEEELLKQKPEFISNLQTKFYEPNGISKSKNQLSALAFNLQENEERIEEQKITYSLKKKSGREKYGW